METNRESSPESEPLVPENVVHDENSDHPAGEPVSNSLFQNPSPNVEDPVVPDGFPSSLGGFEGEGLARSEEVEQRKVLPEEYLKNVVHLECESSARGGFYDVYLVGTAHVSEESCREVNKKVLKVPAIEQKVLDATSNEPWGPHGSNLSDIAQATRNYHEYQLIMVFCIAPIQVPTSPESILSSNVSNYKFGLISLPLVFNDKKEDDRYRTLRFTVIVLNGCLGAILFIDSADDRPPTDLLVFIYD